MDLDQSRYLDYPGLARYCDLVAGVVGEVAANIFGRSQAATHRLRAPPRPGDAAHQHHPRRRRRRAPRPDLPADERAEAVRRQGGRAARAPLQRSLHRADALRRPSARIAPTTRPSRCSPTPTGAPQKPGLMMANIYREPAARDRGRRLRRAAPAHLADADQEALDRDAHQLARPMSAARRDERAAHVAVVGAGWAGLAAAIEARRARRARSPCSRWRRRPAGARAASLSHGAVARQRHAHLHRRLRRDAAPAAPTSASTKRRRSCACR